MQLELHLEKDLQLVSGERLTRIQLPKICWVMAQSLTPVFFSFRSFRNRPTQLSSFRTWGVATASQANFTATLWLAPRIKLISYLYK